MFYALPNSKCVHSKSECIRSRVKNLPAVEWNPSYRRCRYCHWESGECLICANDDSTLLLNCHCTFANHSVCLGCLETHVRILMERPLWDGIVTCPCTHSDRPISNIPHRITLLVDQHKQSSAERNACYPRCPVDEALEDIVTLRCPKCNAAFCDFTGCLAIQCRCTLHFCGLCMESFPTSRLCHTHILNCKWNRDTYGLLRSEYFMSLEDWRKIQHTRTCLRLWLYSFQLYAKTGSTLYAIGVLSHLSSYASILPWSVSYTFSHWTVRTGLFVVAIILLDEFWKCLFASWFVGMYILEITRQMVQPLYDMD